jgi:hypothetical protein
MTLDLGGINWLAVIIATLIYFAHGAIWFAPQTPIGVVDASCHLVGLLIAAIVIALWR